MSIGSKLKELRKQQGLTQSGLSDGIVTRNMLSLIENGLAKPSLSTIMAFAERLNVPIEYLLSENSNISSFSKMDIISQIKSMLKNEEYEKCLEQGETSQDFDDELALILMRCCLVLGERNLKSKRIKTAFEYFEKAAQYCEMTMYSTPEEESRIKRYYQLVYSIAYKKPYNEVPKISYSNCDELCAYIAALNGEDIGDFPLLPEHKSHITIKKLEKNGRYNDAKRAYVDQLKITNDKLTKYFLLVNLQNCFRTSGDLKGAVECSSEMRKAYEALLED